MSIKTKTAATFITLGLVVGMGMYINRNPYQSGFRERHERAVIAKIAFSPDQTVIVHLTKGRVDAPEKHAPEKSPWIHTTTMNVGEYIQVAATKQLPGTLTCSITVNGKALHADINDRTPNTVLCDGVVT